MELYPLVVLAGDIRIIRDHRNHVRTPSAARLKRRIDELVYELYGLTDEEIRIVEEATG